MKPDRPSFSVVAERRFRLAGKAIIEQHNPYFLPVDQQRETCERNGIPFVSFISRTCLSIDFMNKLRYAAENVSLYNSFKDFSVSGKFP